MKKMMMALAALCVAGAASAISVKWTDATGGTTEATYGSAADVNSNTGAFTSDSFTVMVKFTATLGSVANTSSDFFALQAERTDSKWDEVKVRAEGGQWLLAKYKSTTIGEADMTNGDSSGQNIYAALNSGSGSLPITIIITYNADKQSLLLAASCNNEKIFSVGSGTAPTYTAGMELKLNDITGLAYDSIVAIDGTALDAESALVSAERGEITIVPEPTALALLALGVAGLALRRKAA